MNAGGDKAINKGEQVTLGSTAPASGGSGNYTYLWTPSTGLDRVNVANPTASPDTTTTYTLTVEDAGNCTKTSSVTVAINSITGVEDMADRFGLSVFPNPNDGIFFITSTKELDLGPIQLEIYDPLGKLLHHETIEGPNSKLDLTIRLGTFSKGLFILRLSGSKLNIIQKVTIH